MALYGGPLHVPCVPLGRFVTVKFDEFGDRTALIDPSSGRVFTYRHLSSSVRRLARGLISVGFKKGDILCMFSTNVLEYPVVYFAVASVGGIFQATNPLYNASELQHTLDLCNTAFVVTIPALLSTVKQANFRGEVIVIGGDKGCINYSSLVSEEFSNEPINDGHIDPKNEVGAILFSSGTTGKPKAVQITHYALVANVLQILYLGDGNPGFFPVVQHSHNIPTTDRASGNYKETDCYVTFLPFFHIYGLGHILTLGLYIGAQNVVMTRFEPTEYLNNLQKYRPTVLHLVPPVMVVLSKLPAARQCDFTSVRKVVCGAAPLSKDVENTVMQVLKIDHITQAYGLTECAATHLSPDGEYRFGSVGSLLPGVECQIVDMDTKKALPVGENGEVCLRSPAVMKGYKYNPGATAAMLDEDGWLRTADIGHMDKDGFLYVVDRIKELIKYKGFQVAPAELEDVLLSHPDVADAGVIGVPDVEAGELPKAFVVRKAGCSVTEQEIQDFVSRKVSGTKKLRGGVTFLSEIPKSASGKILRRLLRDTEKNTRSKL